MVVELDKKTEVEETVLPLESYGLNQIKAASYTYQAIHSLEIVNQDPSLKAVKETDVYRLRRGLCLPCAAATCINKVKGERLIGDEDGELKVGDFFRFVLPFHGSKGLDSQTGKEFSNGWLVVTPEGDVYHQAIIAFAEALDVEARAVRDFESVIEFRPIVEQGGALAVSLDNRFVIEQTLRNDPELVVYEGDPQTVRPKILIKDKSGYDYREFQNGRHVVAILEFEGNRALINDSFFLPQMRGSLLMKLDVATIDSYLKYQTGGLSRGIVFSSDPKIEDLVNSRCLYPVVVPTNKVESIRKNLEENLEPSEASLVLGRS